MYVVGSRCFDGQFILKQFGANLEYLLSPTNQSAKPKGSLWRFTDINFLFHITLDVYATMHVRT